MSERLKQRALKAFAATYGAPADRLFAAPGRVNLIGEHTDYNDGFVLPCTINLATLVAAAPIEAPRIEVHAADCDAYDTFDLDRPIAPTGAHWQNYVRGVAAMFVADGYRLQGARLAVAGDVPQGSGLSSSASLEMAVAAALARLSGLQIAPTAMAKLAQRAENEFAGAACGIMDQLVAAHGAPGHALRIDCRSLEVARVAIPADWTILIADSGVRHAHVEGAYAERRRQCEAAARHFGVAALRDLDLDRLDAATGLDDVLRRRARHIVTENARVLAMTAALGASDLAAVGRLMADSHRSMRDDFEITVPEIDRLVAVMAEALAGAGGARMTGGGFGGCAVALCHRDTVEPLAARIREHYRTPAGAPATIILSRPAGAARELAI
jgi:galactokinase